MSPALVTLLRRYGLEKERGRIKTHLEGVEQALRSTDVNHLSEDVRSARFEQLDRLKDYWRAGKFPRNHDFANRHAPCFVDRDGQACAVAYLLACSGQQQLVDEVSHHANHALVADIQTPAFEQWIAASGLTRAELAWIQPVYGGEEELVRLVGHAKLFTACVGLAVLGTVVSVIQFLRGIGRSYWLLLLVVALAGMFYCVRAINQLEAIVKRLQHVMLLRPRWDLELSWPLYWLNDVPSAPLIAWSLLIVCVPAVLLPRSGKDALAFKERLAVQAVMLLAVLALWVSTAYSW
ncbi:MAG: hypothetical protein AB7K24_11565 [Gemmataceae bacterium]